MSYFDLQHKMEKFSIEKRLKQAKKTLLANLNTSDKRDKEVAKAIIDLLIQFELDTNEENTKKMKELTKFIVNKQLSFLQLFINSDKSFIDQINNIKENVVDNFVNLLVEDIQENKVNNRLDYLKAQIVDKINQVIKNGVRQVSPIQDKIIQDRGDKKVQINLGNKTKEIRTNKDYRKFMTELKLLILTDGNEDSQQESQEKKVQWYNIPKIIQRILGKKNKQNNLIEVANKIDIKPHISNFSESKENKAENTTDTKEDAEKNTSEAVEKTVDSLVKSTLDPLHIDTKNNMEQIHKHNKFAFVNVLKTMSTILTSIAKPIGLVILGYLMTPAGMYALGKFLGFTYTFINRVINIPKLSFDNDGKQDNESEFNDDDSNLNSLEQKITKIFQTRDKIQEKINKEIDSLKESKTNIKDMLNKLYPEKLSFIADIFNVEEKTLKGFTESIKDIVSMGAGCKSRNIYGILLYLAGKGATFAIEKLFRNRKDDKMFIYKHLTKYLSMDEEKADLQRKKLEQYKWSEEEINRYFQNKENLREEDHIVNKLAEDNDKILKMLQKVNDSKVKHDYTHYTFEEFLKKVETSYIFGKENPVKVFHIDREKFKQLNIESQNKLIHRFLDDRRLFLTDMYNQLSDLDNESRLKQGMKNISDRDFIATKTAQRFNTVLDAHHKHGIARMQQGLQRAGSYGNVKNIQMPTKESFVQDSYRDYATGSTYEKETEIGDEKTKSWTLDEKQGFVFDGKNDMVIKGENKVLIEEIERELKNKKFDDKLWNKTWFGGDLELSKSLLESPVAKQAIKKAYERSSKKKTLSELFVVDKDKKTITFKDTKGGMIDAKNAQTKTIKFEDNATINKLNKAWQEKSHEFVNSENGSREEAVKKILEEMHGEISQTKEYKEQEYEENKIMIEQLRNNIKDINMQLNDILIDSNSGRNNVQRVIK